MDRLEKHSTAHALPPPEGADKAPQEAFKTLEHAYFLGHVPRPVALVCVGENPLVVAWHMPANKEPFLYAIAIAKENYSHILLENGSDFTVNFLKAEYLEDMLKAGRHHGGQVDKWKLFRSISPVKASRVDAFMVKEALLVYECRQEKMLNLYDHSLFIGKVEVIHYRKGKLKPQKVKYPLHMGKGYFSRNSKVYSYKI